jgi:hypothetical protein
MPGTPPCMNWPQKIPIGEVSQEALFDIIRAVVRRKEISPRRGGHSPEGSSSSAVSFLCPKDLFSRDVAPDRYEDVIGQSASTPKLRSESDDAESW